MTDQHPRAEILYEALQEREAIARYLHSIADGLSSGTLRLSSDDVELEMHPPHLVGFELQSTQEAGRSRLRMRLTWREEAPGTGKGSEGLRIRSE